MIFVADLCRFMFLKNGGSPCRRQRGTLVRSKWWFAYGKMAVWSVPSRDADISGQMATLPPIARNADKHRGCKGVGVCKHNRDVSFCALNKFTLWFLLWFISQNADGFIELCEDFFKPGIRLLYDECSEVFGFTFLHFGCFHDIGITVCIGIEPTHK